MRSSLKMMNSAVERKNPWEMPIVTSSGSPM
jgi:hypothetical protein